MAIDTEKPKCKNAKSNVVIAFPGTASRESEAIAEPNPEIIELLEWYLARARQGELLALLIAGVSSKYDHELVMSVPDDREMALIATLEVAKAKLIKSIEEN